MPKSVVRWTLLLSSGLALGIALSPPLQRKLDQQGLIPNPSAYGDLYHRTFLRQFREGDFLRNQALAGADKPAWRARNVNLYTLGDSFTEIDTSFYAGHRNVHVWLTFGTAPADLDRSRKNILVIEVLERLIQQRLRVRPDSTVLIREGLTDPKAVARPVTGASGQNSAGAGWVSWLTARFGADLDYRLERLFFSSGLFVWLKERRAQLLLNGFGRVPAGVVSRDGRHLFYDLEVDTTFDTSAFRHLSHCNTDSVVATINHVREHYRRLGFDEVYFSLVPNKVTVIDPQRGPYNHQIERIEGHPNRRAPLISLYDTLTKHPDWYHRGDGHWNRLGKRYWLKVVNDKVAEWDTYGADRSLRP